THRHLHSFPTRRSSDLYKTPPREWRLTQTPYKFSRPKFPYQFLIQRSCCVAGGAGVGDGATPAVLHRSKVGLYPLALGSDAFFRSEEHTSELQSRVDIV